MSASDQNAVRYLFNRPENGTPMEVAPGIFWLRQALPFALDHVNLWLLRGDEGWTLVDCGYDNEESRRTWENLLSGFLGRHPVIRIIATHFHPDHAGLAGWLGEKTGAPLAMSRTEWLTARMLKLDDSAGFADAGASHDRRAGLDPDLIAKRHERGNQYRRGVSLPHATYAALKAGDEITIAGDQWRILIGRGHAPEMVTLFCPARALLIAADQILPRISPVVGVWASSPDEDPLADFKESLKPYRSLPQDTTVLPSHDGPFLGLHERIDQLLTHHENRLGKTLDACRQPKTLAQIMPSLFRRKLDIHNTGFALGEALAHVNHLWRLGELSREADSNGVWYYRSNS